MKAAWSAFIQKLAGWCLKRLACSHDEQIVAVRGFLCFLKVDGYSFFYFSRRIRSCRVPHSFHRLE